MKFLKRMLPWSLLVLPSLLTAQTIGEDLVRLVSETVFEVVVEKPSEGGVQYETPLPAAAFASQSAADRFYSIGTAFAVAGGKLLSASHVFSPSQQTQIKNYYIRTRDRRVYPINRVYQFSDSHDFIVFDAEGFQPAAFLELEPNFKLNTAVYAVGNALGDGIVIRDGLLTSTTPENEGGKWDWLRFSAPASQGNSGGPLLDTRGRVVGLILMKSHNENLNFALPVSEILAFPQNTGRSFQKIKYTLSNLNNYLKPAFFKSETVLPLPFSQFSAQLKAEFSEWTRQLVAEIKADWKPKAFPYGRGSEAIFWSSGLFAFPGMIAQRQDGGWGIFSPQTVHTSQLENGGKLQYGKMADFTLFQLTQAAGQRPMELLTHSKQLGELLLQGLPFYRDVEGQLIRLTSFGKAQSLHYQKDQWGRVWVSALWALPYSDSMVLTYLLPVPGGWVGMIHSDSTHSVLNAFVHDFRYMSDFVMTSYSGTFENWTAFLELKDLLPNFMKASLLNYQNGLHYSDSMIAFAQPNGLGQWGPKSTLTVGLSFESSDKNVFLLPKSYQFNDQEAVPSFFEIKKILNPAHFKSVSDSYQKYVNSIAHLLYPYNGSLQEEKGILRRVSVASNRISNDFLLLSCSTLRPNAHAALTAFSERLTEQLFNPRFFAKLTPPAPETHPQSLAAAPVQPGDFSSGAGNAPGRAAASASGQAASSPLVPSNRGLPPTEAVASPPLSAASGTSPASADLSPAPAADVPVASASDYVQMLLQEYDVASVLQAYPDSPWW